MHIYPITGKAAEYVLRDCLFS